MIAYNLRFPGQYFDQETGKHYNYLRDYDPSTGRYIESDPIGLTGGLNTYAYVDASPLSLTDERGLYDSRMRGAPGNDPYPGCAGNDPSCRAGFQKPKPFCCDDDALALCFSTKVTLAGSCLSCRRSLGTNIRACAQCARGVIGTISCFSDNCGEGKCKPPKVCP